MNITNVKIKRVADSGNMRAVVSVTFDDMFVVHDMKIIEGQNGLFLAMPSKRLHSGEYRDIAHPIPVSYTHLELGNLGAAMLAGVGVGVYRDLDEAVEKMVKVTKHVEPDSAKSRIYEDKYAQFNRAIEVLGDFWEK